MYFAQILGIDWIGWVLNLMTKLASALPDFFIFCWIGWVLNLMTKLANALPEFWIFDGLGWVFFNFTTKHAFALPKSWVFDWIGWIFLMKDREDRQNRQNRQDRQNRQERQERQDGQDRQTLSGYVGRYLTILVRTILLNFVIFPLWQRNEPSFQTQTNWWATRD